jgi:argininosuccinate synthase
MVENRLVGMKSRGVYETPGGTLLYKAHHLLEELALDRDTLHYKQEIAHKWAELCYYGLWFTPLMSSLNAFFKSTQEYVSGEIKLKLYKGNMTPVSRKAKHSLYWEELATFEKDEVYNQKDAAGFINLWGLPTKVIAIKRNKK